MDTRKIGLRLLVLWLALLAAGAVGQRLKNDDGKEAALSGLFGILWVDAQGGEAHQPLYFIQSKENTAPIFLTLDEATLETFGGAHALIGKNVEVEGIWKSARLRQLILNKIQLGAPETVPHAPVRPTGGITPLDFSGSKSWATILVRFSDSPTVTPKPKTYFDGLMSSTYPGIDHYWREQSYDQVNIAGSQSFGWYNLPHPKSYYLNSGGDGCSIYKLDLMIADAVAVSDGEINFSNFYGFQLMFNENVGGWACGTSGWWLTLDGQTRYWGVTWMPSWAENAGIVGHEIGHGFGLDHSSGSYSETYDSRWDQMSGGNNGNTHPTYGGLGVHTNSFHKSQQEWIPPSRRRLIAPGTSATLDIERIAQPGNNSLLMAQVFKGGWASRYYTIEARKFAGYDSNAPNSLPAEGVVIHDVDTARTDRRSQVVDADNNGNPNDAGATWLPGETFTDAANGIQIRVLSTSGTTYRVQITDSSTHTPQIVTNSNDVGPGSLRNAINWMQYFPQTIQFHIPLSDPGYHAGVFRIEPISMLPVITTSQIAIDATTQTAFLGNLNTDGPEVLLDGSLAGQWGQGVQVEAGQVTIRGLTIGGFGQSGIWFRTNAGSGGIVEGCYIGTDPTGTARLTNGWAGISITDGAANIRVGGTTSAQGNLISGNESYGVFVTGQGCSGISILGNKIGTNATGNGDLNATWGGIGFFGGSHDNTVGGTAPGSGNLISGQTSPGVAIAESGHHNLIQGNRLGTDATGIGAVPNRWAGVGIWGGAHHNTVSGNVLSGNTSSGVAIRDPGTENNRVIGNLIGTNAQGNAAVANGWSGVELWNGAQNNIIGGSTAAERNIISGNVSNGVAILNSIDQQTRLNQVIGNYIGTDIFGVSPIPNNTGVGIWGGAKDNIIGTGEANKGNLISGNSGGGVVFWDNGTSNNRVQGNKIGTKVSGMVALSNGWAGIGVQVGAHNNLLGGAGTGEGNLISSNNAYGIIFVGADGSGNVPHHNIVLGNRIGTNITGTGSLANGGANIVIDSGSHHNQIGGIAPGEGNTLANSPYEAIWIGGVNGDAWGVGNTLRGNLISNSTWLGIDLSGGAQIGWNVTQNDTADADIGPNDLQNYPAISSVSTANGIMTFTGTLNSKANTQYALDFYRVDTAHSSNYGVGSQYVGTTTVTTNSSGNASFAAPLITSGALFTATATNLATGDTSEFSNNVTASNVVSVSGTVTLQNCPTNGVAVTLEFRLPNNSRFTRNLVLNAAGTFTLTGIPRASYTVAFKGSKWLRKVVAVNALDGNVSNVTALLKGGDANNDNAADITDLLVLIAAYNKVAPAIGYNDTADFNNDGANDIADLLLLIGNYNQLGDN